MMCCYYPTTIVALDDDKDFLRTIGQHLGIPNATLFTSPEAAITQLEKDIDSKRIETRLLNSSKQTLEEINPTPENYALFINLRALHEEIYSQNRFHDVSVMIIDYHMGEISGLDVCEKLASHPAKKILLTGGADKERVAIEAFNKGIIHRFINKSDKNFPTQLKQAITILQEAYFKDLTNTLIPRLPIKSAQLLQNSSYINLLCNLKDQVNAVEYYLLDISGSVLLLNAEGIPTWLIIKSKEELNDYHQIALDSDAPKSILESIKAYKKIPFFFSENDYEVPANNWDIYLYDANPFPGIPNHYYSIIKGNIRDNIKNDELFTYENYLKNIKNISIKNLDTST